ncbi:MAG TPA: hypothetical protein V6C85_36290 [Allocoleopsis sp.]
MLVEEKSALNDNPTDPDKDTSDKGSNESTDSSAQWDRSSLAKLVGLDDDDDDNKSGEHPSIESSERPELIGVSSDDDGEVIQGNVLGDDELFDDPHSSATPKTVAKSPFAKFGLVAGGLGVVFLLAGLLLNGIMSPKGELKAKSPTPTPTPTVEAQKQENTEGQLKTELALNSQSDELKQLDEAKKNQKKQEVSPTDPKRQKTTNGKATSPTPTTAAATTSASSPGPRTYSSSPPRVSSPPVRPAPVASSQPLKSAPASTPFSQVAASTPSAPKPSAKPASDSSTVQAQPSKTPTAVAATPATPQVDPMTQWQTLASLGSYSTTPDSQQNSQVTTETPSGAVANIERDTTQQRQQRQVTATPVSQSQTSPQSAPMAVSPELAEQRLLDGTPYRVAASGSMVTGVLATPAIVPADSPATPSRVVVTLKDALTDASGQIVMPSQTSLVFEVRGIDSNGVMNAVAVSQLDNTGMERPLPADALVLAGERGSPLIAKGYFDDGGTIASMDLSTAVLGALGKFGEILNRPKQQTSSSVSGGTVSQTTTSTTGDPNILGALLEGGASPVLEQIMKRNERAIQDMQQRKNLWFLEAGTSVQIVVTHSFEL